MLFPDCATEMYLCPICNQKLHCDFGSYVNCKRYYCVLPKSSYRLGSVSLPHYEFYRYPDGSVFMQYIIPPIHVMSQENATTIYLMQKDIYAMQYIEYELTTKKGSMFLVRDNIEEIKNKIKVYSLFS